MGTNIAQFDPDGGRPIYLQSSVTEKSLIPKISVRCRLLQVSECLEQHFSHRRSPRPNSVSHYVVPYHHGVVAPVLLRATRKEECVRNVREMEVI